jgi:peroxiredoxin Q/BCP
MAKLEVGDNAPDFTLPDQAGKTVRLSTLKGKKVLLYFYPRADTPGCTKQSCSVRDAREDLTGAGVITLGISPDKPEKQKKFDDKFGLGFSLLSDTDHAVAESYGAWGEKNMFGKKVQGIIRSSFLVDEEGKVAQVAYKVKPEDTVPRAQAALS